MILIHQLVIGLWLLSVLASTLFAATYYVSPTGNDTNDGTTETTPWGTVGKVNQTTFQPGERILFKAGGRWTGQLWPLGSGHAGAPITLGSYGKGAKPIIDAQGVDGTAAIKLFNQEYWIIEDMAVTNWADTYGKRWGIYIGANDGRIQHGLTVRGNTVSKVYASPIRTPAKDAGYPSFYRVGGIYFDIPAPGRADGVLIDGNDVTDIVGEGIIFYGQDVDHNNTMNYANCSPNVVIRNNTVSHTAADGIVMLGTDNELVEHNLVAYAGALGVVGTDYIAGMWPTRHINGVWQYNEVHHTKKWLGDGQGLDSDYYFQGTVIFQYNYSHDNEGGFLLDCVAPDAGQTIVRYNLSVRDPVVGVLYRGNALFYNNVFYSPGVALTGVLDGGTTHANKFYNNIFYCAGLHGLNGQIFSHNAYFGGITAMPEDASAITVNPKFVNPNSNDWQAGFQLQPESPCLAGGMLIPNNGGKDLWGNLVSTIEAPNVGVYGGRGNPEEDIPANRPPAIGPVKRPMEAKP